MGAGSGFERTERLKEALSLVAVGEYAAALSLLPEDSDEGEESVALETCVRVLVLELGASHEANARALAQLEESRRQLAERLALIERQRVALADLSTPIIQVWDGTLALPILGAVDAERAQVMSEQLLQRVAELRVRAVIIDLTGMSAGDAVTVENLVRMARGVNLLGARCTLTGIGPALARTLVELGVDLHGLRTGRTLQDGLLASLGRAAARE